MSIFNNSEENSIFKRSDETKKEEPSIFGDSSPDVFSNESPTDIFGSDNLYSNRSPFVSGPNVLKRGYANSSGSSSSGLKSSYTLTIDSDQQQMAEKFKKEFKVFTDSFFKLIENIKDDAFKKQIAEKFINDLESNAKMAMENTETLDKYIKLSIAANKDKSSLTGSGLDYQFGFLVSKGSSLNLKNPDLLFLKNQPTEIKHKKVCLILSLIMNDSEVSPFSLSDEDFKKKIASTGTDLRTKYSMNQWPTELNSVKYWPLYAYLISLFDKGTLNLGDLEKEVNVNIMAEGSGEAPKKKEEEKKKDDKKKDEKKGGGKDDKKKDDKKRKEPKIPFVKERNLRYFLDKYEDYSFGKVSSFLYKMINDDGLYFTVNSEKNKNDLFKEIFFKQGVFDDLKKKLCKEGGNFEEENNENQVFHSAFDYPEKNITINDLYRLREKGNDFENIDEKLKKHICNDKPIDTNFKTQFLKGQSLINYYDKFSLYRINAFQNTGEFQPINSRVMKGLKIYFYSLGKESETFASLLRSKFGVEKKKAENAEKKEGNKKEGEKKNGNKKPQNKQKEDKMRKIREVLKKTNDKLAQTKNANIKKKLEQAKAELLKEYKKLAN